MIRRLLVVLAVTLTLKAALRYGLGFSISREMLEILNWFDTIALLVFAPWVARGADPVGVRRAVAITALLELGFVAQSVGLQTGRLLLLEPAMFWVLLLFDAIPGSMLFGFVGALVKLVVVAPIVYFLGRVR